LLDSRCHSSIFDVAAKVKERLAVGKQAVRYFDVERFNLRNLIELEVRKKYQIKISNWFTALGILNDYENINRAWENIKENSKTIAKESLGMHELKQHKPWCDEECLGFLDQRNQLVDISVTKRKNV